MDETSGGVGVLPDIQEVKVPTHTAVKSHWLDAEKEGNAYWPQERFGTAIFIAAAVLKSDPYHLEDFSKSELNAEQAEEVNLLMSYMHLSHSIGRLGEGHEKPGNSTIPIERIYKAWERSRNDTIYTIGHFLTVATKKDFFSETNEIELAKQIDDFLSVPDNRKYVLQLQSFFSSAKGVLTSSEGKELSRAYKKTFPIPQKDDDLIINQLKITKLLVDNTIDLDTISPQEKKELFHKITNIDIDKYSDILTSQ